MHHDGKCAHLHGHSYTLDIEMSSPSLHTSGPQTNMVTDFSLISKTAKKLIASHLDHRHLNNTMQTDSPTAEFIAQWCFHRLRPSLPNMTAVTIHETASSSATYRPHPPYYMFPSWHNCADSNFSPMHPTATTIAAAISTEPPACTVPSNNNKNINFNNKPLLNGESSIANEHDHENNNNNSSNSKPMLNSVHSPANSHHEKINNSKDEPLINGVASTANGCHQDHHQDPPPPPHSLQHSIHIYTNGV